MARLSASELIELVCDAGSFRSWDAPIPLPEASEDYLAQLGEAAERSGNDEAVLTGEATLEGRRIALVVSVFDFLAGSIGRRTADRIIAAVERATAEGLPLVAAPCSGGTRMQEGTPAFLEMVRISAAVAAHKQAGLPYLVHLRHPTTGGVMASWASMGQVTTAEPGALLGFLGPRVYEALHGTSFPADVQTAENLHARGIIDAVVPAPLLPRLLASALRTMAPEPAPATAAPGEAVESADALPVRDAWQVVETSRHVGRPGVRALLQHAGSDVLTLNGTGQGEADPVVLLALARFHGHACVVVGECRQRHARNQQLGPEGLRVARRGMRLATELRLPLVTVIDTVGAALSADAENGGLAGEISRCLADLAAMPTPTVAVLLGQGTGGAALALWPCDRVVAAENSWLAPLPPEGASAIVRRPAADIAREQAITARDLLAAGSVHRVVREDVDAAEEPEAFCRRVGATIAAELGELAR